MPIPAFTGTPLHCAGVLLLPVDAWCVCEYEEGGGSGAPSLAASRFSDDNAVPVIADPRLVQYSLNMATVIGRLMRRWRPAGDYVHPWSSQNP